MTDKQQPSFKELSKAFFSELWSRLRDPLVLSVIVGAALVVAGFVVIGLAWRGAAATLHVGIQLPYVVSGGLGGLALVFLGVGVLHIQGSRWLAAKERGHMERVRGKAASLLEAASLARKGMSAHDCTPR